MAVSCGGATGRTIADTLKLPPTRPRAWTKASRAGIIELMNEPERQAEVAARVIDLRVMRALRAMQQEPARLFRVRELARIAGASRATFARLFIAATGRSPIRYLNERRLQRAAELLVTTREPLSRIATQVGYRSEFALSRAFKRLHGLSPSRYRAGAAPIRCAA